LQNKQDSLDVEKQDIQRSIGENISKQKIVNLEIKGKKEELNYFKNRENLLPKNLSDIRSLICKNLEIDETHIVFVCELMRVKSSQKVWEMAIEKLLHSF
jgi:uncharacterized protein YPO0396